MGLRQFFKQVLPEHHEIREHKHLQLFGDILHDPDIFHLTRRSVAGGVANGLFFACSPIPGQTILAAIVSIVLRINLPISVILVWLTNPITFPPYLFIAYKTGAFILNEPARQVAFEFTLNWFSEKFVDVWQPLLVGCLTFGIISSASGYVLIRLLWRLAIIVKWEGRKNLKKTRTANDD